MERKHIHNVPVERDEGELLGVVTARELVGIRGRLSGDEAVDPVAVTSVMRRDFTQVALDTSPSEATRLIVGADTGCLLVVAHGIS